MPTSHPGTGNNIVFARANSKVIQQAGNERFSNKPTFERALENSLAQACGAFERAFDFGFGLRDVGEFGFELGNDFGLLRERSKRERRRTKLLKRQMSDIRGN